MPDLHPDWPDPFEGMPETVKMTSRRREYRRGATVYLLHFSRPYAHAAHYCGVALDGDVQRRIAEHANGRGARLMEVVTAAGIGFTLARTWPGGQVRERQIKRQGGLSRSCPVCRKARKEAACSA